MSDLANGAFERQGMGDAEVCGRVRGNQAQSANFSY